MKFWKYHGIGNDFIVLDCITDPVPVDPASVRTASSTSYLDRART